MESSTTKDITPWHAAYPTPDGTPASISREELLQYMREGAVPGRDFLLVDLRRNDHEVPEGQIPTTSSVYVPQLTAPGRHNRRINQHTRTKSISNVANDLQSRQECRHFSRDLVLWYASVEKLPASKSASKS